MRNKPLLDMVDDWRAFVSIAAAGHDVEAIRRHERTGRPLGVQAFLKRLKDSLGGRGGDAAISSRCSSHATGIARGSSSSCIPFGCRPSRIASWMSGASIVSHRRRLTQLRSIYSASAISDTEPWIPSSSIRFQRCARASARICVSSCHGFAGAHASPPSGVMIRARYLARRPSIRQIAED
ncbi:MAG: hypothetical protein WAS73_11765 [Defluviicoccus sp.]